MNSTTTEFPTLYSKTGDIKDINTLLVTAGQLAALIRTATQPALPLMSTAFRTTISGNGKYEMVFSFRDLNAMHAADDEWINRSAAAPVAQPVQPHRVPLTDESISLMAHNADDGDWNDSIYRDCWLRGYKEGARAGEIEHGITE